MEWKSLTTRGLVFAAAMLGSRATGAQGAEFCLARNRKPVATIVVSSQPTPAAAFAASELQYHVLKITGATLPVAADDMKVTGPRVLVGKSAATKALGLHSRDFKSQEYLIRFMGDALVLVGKDTPRSETAASTPKHVAGKCGKALSFDGTKDVVTVPDCGFSDEAGTMEAWVWLPSAPQEATHGTILRLDGAHPWTYHIIQRDHKTSRISYTTYDGTNGHRLSSRDLAEGWYHVVGTHDAKAGKMALFIDGVSQGTTRYVKTTCKGARLGIGGIASRGGSSVGNPFKGIIDEVRISKVVRGVKTDAAGGPYTPEENTTSLFHFDEAAGAPRDSAGPFRGASPPELFGDNGTLYAVYDFLERFCDVRWYAPTDIGLVCPAAATLKVRGTDVRRSPAMIHRWITSTPLYMPGPQDRVPGRDVHVWKLRMRIGGQAFWVCHSFGGYYGRFLKAHPDWFAQGYPGKPPQMCYTHPEFVAQVIQDARDYFDGKGAKAGSTARGDVFGLVPMDNSRWCKCPKCQAEMNKAEESNTQFNNGRASDYVFNFVNKVAREVRKTHPDKWIGALAYSTYAYYPEKVKPAQNIIVQLCLHTRNWWCPSMEANDRKVLKEWRERGRQRPLYLWLYYNFPALNAKYGRYSYFPGYFAHAVLPQMKLYDEANIRGIFMEHSSEFGQSYLMDQLEFYVTLKLADDPKLDGNKLIDEFFERYYGAAAQPMKALYCAIEDTYSTPKCYPLDIQQSPGHQHQNEKLAWGALGTDARMAEFAKLMQQARNAAKTPIEKQRLALFEQGQWDYMVEGRRKYLVHAKLRAQPPPRVRVPRLPTDAGPVRLDQIEWSKAADLGKWSTLAGDPTERKLEARVAHDGKYLYVQLAEYLDTAGLKAGGQIWDGDDFELFFALQRKPPYRQLCVGPTGKHVALAHREKSPGWDSGAVVSSDASGRDRWTVRVALPLDKLMPGGLKPGSKFYANFYRASPRASNLLAWTPNFASGFHDTSRLGEFTLE